MIGETAQGSRLSGIVRPSGWECLYGSSGFLLPVAVGLFLTYSLVSRLRDSWRTSRSAALGWPGATTEDIGHM